MLVGAVTFAATGPQAEDINARIGQIEKVQADLAPGKLSASADQEIKAAYFYQRIGPKDTLNMEKTLYRSQ